jgi:GAF domain-containing protein
MKSAPTTVSELAFIFKLLPLFQEVDTVDRLYRLLLAIVTSGQSVGYTRAILLVPDGEGAVIRGRFGAGRAMDSARPDSAAASSPEGGFEEMARSVFKSFENVDASDLTVKARAYAVPFGWHRSAIVKAYRTTYPVLAERGLSEFATDTFFDFFGVTSYIAVPVEFDRRVLAVLAVDRSARLTDGSAEEISVLYSIVQQTAAAAHRLLESSNDRRKARIMAKLHDSLHASASPSEFEESLRVSLSMICRAVDASACVLRDGHTRKSIRVESPDRAGETAPEAETRAIEDLLDLVSGRIEPAGGDGSDPRLPEDARDRVAFFQAYPIVADNEPLGAIAVYTVKDDPRARLDGFQPGEKAFVELCTRGIGSAIRNRRALQRIGRLENFIEEMGSNLVRERERSRIGDKSIEFHGHIDEALDRLRKILSGDDASALLAEIGDVVESMGRHSAAYWDEVLSDTTSYSMTDLYDLVRRAVEVRRPTAEKKGIQIATRIPGRGPELLLDRESVSDAIERLLATTLSTLGKGDKMLVECSQSFGRAVVCIADNGHGLPGDVISRLFMPFDDAGERDKETRSLSLAGNVLRRHSAAITVKSSRSWRTILGLSFPMAAGRDRRKKRAERRRRGERRVPGRSG